MANNGIGAKDPFEEGLRIDRVMWSLRQQDPLVTTCYNLHLFFQEEFDEDLVVIEESLKPLVLKCKELGRAMRIGTNHGSLSARVLSFYGDTPRGMVESAVEFANICRYVVCYSHGPLID